MICLSFDIKNPFSTRFTTVYSKSGNTWMYHKFWELNLYKSNTIIRCISDFTIRQDHAGFSIELGLFGWDVEFRIYDNRHWNSLENCWEVEYLTPDISKTVPPTPNPPPKVV